MGLFSIITAFFLFQTKQLNIIMDKKDVYKQKFYRKIRVLEKVCNFQGTLLV